MPNLRRLIKQTPLIGPLATTTQVWLSQLRFAGSPNYWEQRYVAGGNSGVGSQGRLAEFKADVLNTFVTEQAVRSVVELGCGDGQQLALARYPRYLGLDISPTAVRLCTDRFGGDPTRRFELYDPETFQAGQVGPSDLALSLDVIYHLVEDQIYERYLEHLFALASRFVIVYSSNTDENVLPRRAHIRHRRFTSGVEQHAPAWRLTQHIPNAHPYRGESENEPWAEFYVYEHAA